jgi:hypothetical protein
VLPSYIPLDLLKFLKLWDYEGGLTAEVSQLQHGQLLEAVHCELLAAVPA